MRIYTVGHSNHTSAVFMGLLRKHEVTAVADVRSVPYSRFNPQFNRETLARALEAHGVEYLFLGRELGARPEDPACYRNGRVLFSRLAATAEFRRGLDRLTAGADDAPSVARGRRLALMCAEKDPLDCHRTILVARKLAERGIEVAHILPDRRIAEPHDETVERLLARHGLDQPDLFMSRADRIDKAYTRAERIAWVDEGAGGPARGPAAPGAEVPEPALADEDAGGPAR